MMGSKWDFSPRMIVVATLAAIATDQVLGRFVLQSDMNPGGLVPVGGGILGIGLDDLARGVGMLAVWPLADKIVPKF